MDWNDVTRQIEDAVLAAFDDLAAATRGQQVYALALVTEDGAMSVGVAANTEEAFQEHLAAERGDEDDLSPEDEAWFRWGVGEWRHEGWRDDLFAAVNRLLGDAAIEGGTDDAPLAPLIEAMTAALVRLRREREAEMADTALFVMLTDSDEAEAVENASAARTNPPPLLEAFRSRYG